MIPRRSSRIGGTDGAGGDGETNAAPRPPETKQKNTRQDKTRRDKTG